MDREFHNRGGVRVITGGLKEFKYKKEDLVRIESEDTESTKAFKKELHFWQKHRFLFWCKYNKKKALFGLIMIVAVAVLLLLYIFH